MALLVSNLGIRFSNGSSRGYLPARRPIEIEDDLVDAALAEGARYVDEQPAVTVNDSKQPKVVEEEDPSTLLAVLVKMMDEVSDPLNSRGDPKLDVLSDYADCKVSAKDRDTAWEAFQKAE